MSVTCFSDDQQRALAAAFDLRNLPADYYDNPFPYYHALRRFAPVKPLPDGSIMFSRYDDVKALYADAERFSSDKKVEFGPKFGDSLLFEHHTSSLVFTDPPRHSVIRPIVMAAFTSRALTSMEPRLETLVARLLDELEQQSEPDLIEHYAGAIPVEVIADLLAVPRSEREPLRRWSLAILSALEPKISPQVFERGNEAVQEMLDYLAALIAQRRRQPGDPDRDMLTRLIMAQKEEGTALSEQELLHNSILLLNAGHETTTNLVGNGLVALHDWPEQRQLLVEQPGLIRSACEELLRFESSNQLGSRITTCDVEFGGIEIPANTPLVLGIGAANRDPTVFENPDFLDIQRKANRHLAFGFGLHQCAGMNLGRMEGRIAISRFLERFPEFELGERDRAQRARFRSWHKALMK
ncbi:MAG: cytochrome P450 [Marinobacterium sp.]|nr:cytochrome P450 [Marinobacterium sp.]